MKRRDLIKTGIFGLGASAVALSGCDKKDNISLDVDFDIKPKQTDIYKISAPMLFDFDAIDTYASWNKKYKKSQVTSLYNSIPWPQSEKFNEWFMLYRGGSNPDIKTYSDYEKYAKYAMDKGFEIVYLMNSPKAFNDRDIEPFKKDFYTLLDNLWKTGIRKIKFANTQVAQLINEYNPNFELSVATILEYTSISQYRALISLFPNIKHICVPKDLNQNFRFLAALKQAFPKIEIEMMVNEGCLKWCPTRFSCMASSYNSYYKLGCKFTRESKYINIALDGEIRPWDIEYYSAIGINNFKILSRAPRAFDKDTSTIGTYMATLEDKDNLMPYLNNYFNAINVDPKKIISLFPQMKHFVKHGHECATRCGVECKYCYECARNIEKVLLS